MTSGLVIIFTAIVLIVLMLYKKRTATRQVVPLLTDLKGINIEPDSVVNFGYKCIWYAVKTDDKSRLAEIFDLKNIYDCNWKIGIEKAYKGAVFITPTIDNWTLAVGWGLPYDDGENGIEKVKNVLRILSREFGEAQFFCTHRITEYHCWMKATSGNVVRTYCYVGENAENTMVEGYPTEFEQTLNLVNTLSEEAKNEEYFENKDITWPDEDIVMQIAGHWSIDPTQLEQRQDIKPGLGLVGC